MILDFCKLTPRPQQVEALTWLEQNWDAADVFVLQMPVGAGKSMIAHTLAKWQESLGRPTTIITPTHMLRHQYTLDYPDLVSNQLGLPKHSHGFLYSASCRLMDYYSYLAHRAYTPTLITDEAHQLIPFLQKSITLWHHQMLSPPPKDPTLWSVLSWLEPMISRMKSSEVALDQSDKRLLKFWKELQRSPENYSLESDIGPFRGKDRAYLRLTKLSPRDEPPFLWPPHRVKKLVLMSATFSEEDLWDLGLDGRRVKILEVGSPIPASRRPFVTDYIGSLGMESQEKNLPRLKEYILEKLGQFPEKGLIHVTYSLGRKLESILEHPRVLWHDKLNKDKVYQYWLNSDPKEGLVLVGAGMTEGLDLKYDRAIWQIITKVNYPNMSDIAVYEKMRHRPRWFSWVAAREVIQATGRVCRAPDDLGYTFIVDNCFHNLYKNNSDLFPQSWKDGLV